MYRYMYMLYGANAQVEIVMGLEEEFNINIEEDSSQNIATVQDAANLIEEFVQKKAEAS